ncbi:MAG TPA: FecR family protein [Gallionella sp.]|jgi:hypothetical protein|nr:FecR family protein [Gallionella sp.]
MFPQQRFKLTSQAILLATISAAFPVTGYCIAAGRTDFVIGDVVAIAADGSRRSLNKGSEINAGDAINTAAGARAQVRFSDGGYISLQPNTQFRVDEFSYKNKAEEEEKGFFSLLKGGFRAITGAIGHFNRSSYRVTTPAATIGIRGTGYNAVLRDDGLFVSVGEGAISLTNNTGLLVVTAGGAAFVADFNTAPAPTGEQPQTPPAGLQPDSGSAYSVSEQRDSSGSLSILPVSLTSGPGYTLAYAGMDCAPPYGCGGFSSYSAITVVDAIFSGSSQLLQYNGDGAEGGSEGGALDLASVTFSATDGIIGWGRWDGTTTAFPVNFYGGPHPLADGVFHYAIGIPTATMPTTGVATYSLMGYTNPSDTNLEGGWSVNGSLTADFAASNVGVNLSVANASHNYLVSGQMFISGANFSGFPSVSGCASGCSATVNGFFAGANASRAGLAYDIYDYAGPDVQGAAAFISGGITPGPY